MNWRTKLINLLQTFNKLITVTKRSGHVFFIDPHSPSSVVWLSSPHDVMKLCPNVAIWWYIIISAVSHQYWRYWPRQINIKAPLVSSDIVFVTRQWLNHSTVQVLCVRVTARRCPCWPEPCQRPGGGACGQREVEQRGEAEEERDAGMYENIEYIVATCGWFHCDDVRSFGSVNHSVSVCSTQRHTV